MVKRSIVHERHVKRANIDRQLERGLISETEHAIAVLDLEHEHHVGDTSYDWVGWVERYNTALAADDEYKLARARVLIADGTVTRDFAELMLGELADRL